MVTPFLPGDSLLFVAGALASLETNDLNVHMMVVLMLIAAIVGDAVNYTIGRLFGDKLFSNPDSKIFRRSYLDKTHQFYEKHGGKTIILARFVPIVRTFAPFVAGMGHMSYRHFAAFNVIGALLWVLILPTRVISSERSPSFRATLTDDCWHYFCFNIARCFRIYSPQTRCGTRRKIKSNSAVRPLFYPSFGLLCFNVQHSWSVGGKNGIMRPQR